MSEKQEINLHILLDNQINQSESLLLAVLLAKNLKVRLQGLFIEEETLLRAAELPLSREVALWSAQESQITAQGIQRAIRTHARHLQKALEKIACEKKIDYSFQVVRGEKINWIQENIRHAGNMLFVGGHDLRPKAHQAFQYCSELPTPVVVLFTGSASSEHALEVAARIVERNARPLLILLAVDHLSDAEPQKQQIDSLLKSYPDIISTVETLLREHALTALQRRRINIFIFPNYTEWFREDEALRQFMQQVRYPILLLR